MNLLEALSDGVWNLVDWVLEVLGLRKRETWCAAFYFVGQEGGMWINPVYDPKGTRTLDHKIHEAISALTLSSYDQSRLTVVYRAAWADEVTDPVALILPSGLSTIYFPPCYEKARPPIDTTKDLPCFLNWVYKHCPADRYALFFYGHSFGPAGLFVPRGPVNIPRPMQVLELRLTFQNFNRSRRRGPLDPPGSDVTPDSAIGGRLGAPEAVPRDLSAAAYRQEVVEFARRGIDTPKVDLVVFQDCWMSTLETAFELQDVVERVLASQSLVPLRVQKPSFIWPYKDLLQSLLKRNPGARLFRRILDFYQANRADVPPLGTVHFSLLELSAVASMTQPLKDLVQSMAALPATERGEKIEKGRVFEIDKGETVPDAGDATLVDVLKMCEELGQDADANIKAAATALGAAGRALVSQNEEVRPSSADPPIGFRGASVLYIPPWPPEDELIADAIFNNDYAQLRFQSDFAVADRWPSLEHDT